MDYNTHGEHPQEHDVRTNTSRRRDPSAAQDTAAAQPSDAHAVLPRRRWPRRLAVGVGALIVVLALAAGVVWMWPVLRVSEITVSGNRQVSVEDVENASGVVTGMNLVRVDEAAAARAVAAVPWVASATVSRSLPGTVAIELEERTVVLFHREGPGQPVLVDSQGIGFVRADPAPGVIEATGKAAEDAAGLEAMAQVAASLEEPVRGQVARIAGPDSEQLELVLADGRTIFWGTAQNSHDKARAVHAILGREGAHWDVSNPALVTVR